MGHMGPRTKMRALAAAVLITATLSGCARPGSTASPTASGVTVQSADATDSNGMRTGVVPSTPVPPPSDADRPDGPPPTPDDQLTDADLADLIRSAASAPSTPESCSGAEVQISLTDSEAITGHRYAQLVATNTSNRTCQLIGWPGLGMRGAWGTALPVVAEHSVIPVNRVGVPEASPDTAVTLAAGGGRAVAEFEWTGALAGHYDEHVSLIAVQLATDQSPTALFIDPDDPVDIGPDTTVKVGAWGQAG